MAEQKNTTATLSKQDSELLYQKIVHFTVKQDRVDEFSQWLNENLEIFSKSLPMGWKFLGCFRTMFHTGKHAWQFRYEIEGMQAYDNLALDENETLDRLFSQIYAVIDRHIPMEVEILKEIRGSTSEPIKE